MHVHDFGVMETRKLAIFKTPCDTLENYNKYLVSRVVMSLPLAVIQVKLLLDCCIQYQLF